MLTNLSLACALIPSLFGLAPAPATPSFNPISVKKSQLMMIEHIPVFVMTPASAAANNDYEITVVLNDVTPTNLVVAISTSRSASFSSLPAHVTVPAGEGSVTFVVRTSSNYQACTISASANGVTTSSASVASEYASAIGK